MDEKRIREEMAKNKAIEETLLGLAKADRNKGTGMPPKETLQALADGKKIRWGTWPKDEFIQLVDGDVINHAGDYQVYTIGQMSNTGWELYEEPEPEYLTREQVLAFLVNRTGIVVRYSYGEWHHPGRLSYNGDRPHYEWAYADEKRGIGTPRKFTKEDCYGE